MIRPFNTHSCRDRTPEFTSLVEKLKQELVRVLIVRSQPPTSLLLLIRGVAALQGGPSTSGSHEIHGECTFQHC